MSGHTWRYQRELTRSHELPDQIRFEVYNENGVFRHVATCKHEDDARLISAAPDLLAIAEAYVADCEDTFYDIEEMNAESKALYQAAKAAIKKARGE